MSALSRALLSLFVMLHVAAGVVGVARDTAWARPLQSLIKPYEQLFGVYQRWGMFAPHPPRVSIWPRAVGVTTSGEMIELATAWKDRDGDGIRRTYDYTMLLDRGLVGDGGRKIRQGYVEWLCAGSATDGQPLTEVQLFKVTQRSLAPRPRLRGAAPEEPKEKKVTQRPCP